MKNASGMRWTWSKTAVRMSKMRPSPIRAEYQRWVNENTASSTASAAITSAIRTTAPAESRAVMWLTTRPASTGVMTAMTALAVMIARNAVSAAR